MKRLALAFLLMMMLAAAAAAQMNYEITSPYITYIKTEDGDMPALIDAPAPQARTYLQRIWESPVSFPRNGTAWRGNQCYQRDLRILSPM